MSDEDWYAEYRRRLVAGDTMPLPHDDEWWELWELRIAEAPAWENTKEEEEKSEPKEE